MNKGKEHKSCTHPESHDVRRRLLLRAACLAPAMALGGAGTFGGLRRAWAEPASGGGPSRGERERLGRFVFRQLKYRGGHWDPHPGLLPALVEELKARTSIDPHAARRVVELTAEELFEEPFLYMAGRYEFTPFSEAQKELLRRYLAYGGFLWAEDAEGWRGYGFDRAFRELAADLFPDHPLRPLPRDHAVYRSYYLLRGLGGRNPVSNHLEGVTLDRWTPLIYCRNDLGGAWERLPTGEWADPCRPGGEEQRRQAFRSGINIVTYALCASYKSDLVHHPFIQERLKRN